MKGDKRTYAELMALLAESNRLLNAATLTVRRKEWLTLGQSLEQTLAQCAAATETGYELASQHIEDNDSIVAQARSELARISRDLPASNQDAASIVEEIGECIADLERSQNLLRQQAEQQRNDMGTFNITLFGRTMSGKSTLMEILTHGDGKSIGKGAQRTTKDVRPYPWQGLTITDVPGIAAYGGEDDENTAHEAARKADLVLFLICESPQPKETEHLTRLRQQGHRILVVHNVKRSFKDADARKIFIRDQDKIFNPAVMDEVSRQFNELAEQYSPGNALPLINTHLLSKFEADRMEPSDERNQLDIASRFWQVESLIVKEVATNGKFLRACKFLELAAAAALEGLDNTHQCARHTERLHQSLSNQARQLRYWWRNQFKRKADLEIDRLVRRTVGKLRDQIPDFVNQYYEDKNLADLWNRKVQSARIEQQTEEAQRRLSDKFRQRVETLIEELEEEIRLANMQIERADIQTSRIRDTRKWWNRGVAIGGVGLSGVTASLWASGSILGWNPVGWALLGAGAILGITSFLGGLFKSKDTKRREAVAKITPQLRDNLNGIERSIREAMNQSLKELTEQIDGIHGHLESQVQGCDQTARLMEETARRQNEALLSLNQKTVKLALDHIGHQGTITNETKVARLPRQATILSTEESFRLPEEIMDKIKSLLNETVVQVNDQPSETSIREALGKAWDEGRQQRRHTDDAEREIAERLASQLNGSHEE